MTARRKNQPFRAALVTGAGQRIGAYLAESLANDGYAVALHCHRSIRPAERLQQKIIDRGGKAVLIAADLSEAGAPARLIHEASMRLGPLSVLVHSASVFVADRLATLDAAGIDASYALHVRAPLLLAKSFATQIPTKSDAVIVHLTDAALARPSEYFLAYRAGKAALSALTQDLALALAPRVRVCAVAPGWVLPSAKQSAANFRKVVKATPLRRATALKEIGDSVRLILASPSMTGQTIFLDSGIALG